MPKVVSLKEEEAQQALENLGLTVNVEYAQYEGEQIGTVVSQEPASGKEIRPGDNIKIVVAAINREIPNISGEKAEDAEKVLREAGFRVIRQESYSNAVAQGRVISQTPEAGSKQLTGSTVTLMICQKSDKGKECFSPAEQFDFAFWLNGSNWEHFRYLHKSQQVGGEFLVYDGGGLDMAVLGLAEIDCRGNVNVSKFGGRVTGPGGFVNIAQNTKTVIFVGTFTAGGLKTSYADGRWNLLQEGKAVKFKNEVEQITFSGAYAARTGKRVLVVTERAVFRLTAEGLELIEIAPGADLERDILAHMEFRPAISPNLKEMDARLFRTEPMGLRLD